MAYQIAANPLTLSDLQGRLPIASLFKWIFNTVVQQLTRFQLTQCVTIAVLHGDSIASGLWPSFVVPPYVVSHVEPQA